MVALEAMACGTPVVASEVGGLAFLIRNGETGFHIRGDNPDELCDRLTALITNPTLREQMGRKARRRALEYSWEKVGQTLLKVFQPLVAAASEPGPEKAAA